MGETTIAVIPQEDSDQMLEVVLVPGEAGGAVIEIRCVSCGDGVGWFCQRRVRLDGKAIDSLMQALSRVQSRLAKRPPREARKVIPFPGTWKSHEIRGSSATESALAKFSCRAHQ